ncbi:MAG: hypothetical protein LBP19_04840 [Treponema sp.]|jgi:hypothetical protein|nr:hypothetical protein [Treponema sp.]
MIRFLLISSLIFRVSIGMFAQEAVNERELLEYQEPVEFISNTALPAKIDSRAAIWEIGGSLGRSIHNGAMNGGQTGRYFVIHCISPEQTGKFDADIFGLGPNVGVDHIRNLRLIIQGYLETAYLYSPEDAALLARYITIYNAVFHKNLQYFVDHYSGLVTSHLTGETAGLSVRFDEWAGQTRIVIPLGNAQPGSLSAVNTTPLTAPEVVEEQRKESDMGIETRQDMVDLKEREAEEAEQKAQTQQQAAAQEEAAIAEERRQLEEENVQAAVQTSQSQTPPEQEQQDRAQQEQELTQREQAVAQQREEAQQNETLAEQKIAEAQQERQEIAQDQQELLRNGEQPESVDDEEQPAPVIALGITLDTASSPLGKIVQIDVNTGKLIKDSGDNLLNMRTVTIVNDAIIALATQNGATSYLLVKIALETLETLEEGTDAISVNSLLWIRESDLYAIVESEPDVFYIARFDADLQSQAVSPLAVHPFASIMFYQNRLLTQRANGDVLFLNPQTLEEEQSLEERPLTDQ